jgi:hypothetical protein
MSEEEEEEQQEVVEEEEGPKIFLLWRCIPNTFSH